MTTFWLQVNDSGSSRCELEVDGLIQCGRRDVGEEEPISTSLVGDKRRLVLAPSAAKSIPRKWFTLEPGSHNAVILRNLHNQIPVRLGNGELIDCGKSRRLVGGEQIIITQHLELLILGVSKSGADVSGQDADLAIHPELDVPSDELEASLGEFSATSGRAVVTLIQSAMRVVADSIGNHNFALSAARATAEIVQLDRAAVLRRTSNEDLGTVQELDLEAIGRAPDGWEIVAEHTSSGIETNELPNISSTTLKAVVEETNTQFYESIAEPANVNADSLASMHCVVAAPIIDPAGEVIGVLYGDRWTDRGQNDSRISDVEGALVDVVAGTIATAMERQKEARFRSNLSEFFSPRVANLLATDRSLLDGRDVTVSVLFCDIRNFSSVTEFLGPPATIEWINDVLGELSRCVVDRDGVLVDYVGDELMAMWGAPETTIDHAGRALESAQAMLGTIVKLRERWRTRLPVEFSAGIGVNTGLARVGNVGSDVKFKYGVLGDTVNFGSRLQSATKQIGVGCLASAATIESAGFATQSRRIAKLNVVGIEQAADVFELSNSDNARWRVMAEQYESALQNYERQDFGQAAQQLGEILRENPTDRPSMLLLSRTLEQLTNPSEEFSPVWSLTRK